MMKAKTYLLAIFAAVLGMFITGCQAPECAELEAICDQCADAFLQDACQAVVEENDAEACEVSIEAFALACP